jgi:hypothetical protein
VRRDVWLLAALQRLSAAHQVPMHIAIDQSGNHFSQGAPAARNQVRARVSRQTAGD